MNKLSKTYQTRKKNIDDESVSLAFSKKEQLKGKTVKKKGSFKESDLQKACELVLKYKGLRFIRIPDQLSRFVFANNFIPIWFKVLVSKYLKSLPDLTIFFKNGTYLCVELKTDVGKMKVGQKAFRNDVCENNYYIVRDVQHFTDLITYKQNLKFKKVEV